MATPQVNDLLTTMRIEETRYVRVVARTPWGVAFPARQVARLLLITRGSCLLTSDGQAEPQQLGENDCFLVRAGVEFALQDAPGRPLVGCEGSKGSVVEAGGDGELTEIVSVRFTFDAVAAETLFALLPPVFRVSADASTGQLLRATFDLIARETAANGLGAGFVAGRLSDVLFVQALRAWCSDVGSGTIGWIAALRDPQLAAAITALHGRLDHPWTVGSLAAVAGMSRSVFAARFKEKTGDTPLDYLTAWRLYRVKVLLRDTSLSVQKIAERTGYRTGTALSRVFLRREGCAPGAWRKQAVGTGA
ncbi:AraC family transcriptional regulator [Amycolatopsis jiangsuensis]|uniref:AraC-like DNA-binding protein n=1 Tax=Amycolatopsis jiangsuensis TaxID=1181879 RepID=A0A840IP88_9PSEU|nr:AraC family transcriptional regulator [Amycolatopsis jiangsuensis]MBB4684281.1 AraC-like DNA-binding protein [Amycolatopsis jiangsuensis]